MKAILSAALFFLAIPAAFATPCANPVYLERGSYDLTLSKYDSGKHTQVEVYVGSHHEGLRLDFGRHFGAGQYPNVLQEVDLTEPAFVCVLADGRYTPTLVTQKTSDRIDLVADDGAGLGTDDIYISILRVPDRRPDLGGGFCPGLTYDHRVIDVLAELESSLNTIVLEGVRDVRGMLLQVRTARLDAEKGTMNLPVLVASLRTTIEDERGMVAAKLNPRTRSAALEAECLIYGLSYLYGN